MQYRPYCNRHVAVVVNLVRARETFIGPVLNWGSHLVGDRKMLHLFLLSFLGRISEGYVVSITKVTVDLISITECCLRLCSFSILLEFWFCRARQNVRSLLQLVDHFRYILDNSRNIFMIYMIVYYVIVCI